MVFKFEREKSVKGFLDLIKESSRLKEEYEKADKADRIALQEKINAVNCSIENYISIDNEILTSICKNINSYSFAMGIESKLISIPKLKIYPVKEKDNGILVNCDSYIAIDCSLFEFDEDNNTISFNKDFEFNGNRNIQEFLTHTLIHEMLHQYSRKGYLYLDGISEGLTDLFAHKIGKCHNINSKLYFLVERVFYLFEQMMGTKELFEDYLNNLDSMPNLTNFFKKYGLTDEDFKKFKKLLDTNLTQHIKGTEPNNDDEIKAFLYNNFVLSYCNNDEEMSKKMISDAFSNSEEIKIDICNDHNPDSYQPKKKPV